MFNLKTIIMIFLFFQLSDRLQEGGPFFMYPLLLMLLLCIALIIYVFIKGDENSKLTKTIGHVGLFALVWGFLGQMIGLVTAFDSVGISGNMSPEILAGGIKVALLNPIFGMFIFLVARLGIIALLFKNK